MNKIKKIVDKYGYTVFVKLLFAPLFLIITTPFMMIKLWWNCRVLLQGKIDQYNRFSGIPAINCFFYWTQAYNLKKFGKRGLSNLIGLGKFNLSKFFYVPRFGNFLFWKFSTLVTLVSFTGFALSHCLWMLNSDNLYPIYIVQLDRDNAQSASELEVIYCQFLEDEHKKPLRWDGYDASRCADNKWSQEEYERDGFFVRPNGDVAGSAIMSIRQRDGYSLFLSRTHDLPEHASSMGFVTLHEMFHIFQNSHITSTDDYDEQRIINGRKSGDNPEHDVPWWHEGVTVYFSYLDYAREINDPSWFKDEMECTLFCEYDDMYGNKSRLQVYKESGIKLNNIRYDENPEPVDSQIGYEVGAWFVA